MEEEDFLSAELCVVPAMKARDVGLDRSLIGAYGHDDRVCAYNEIVPLLDMATPKHTAICLLADKEEIGSVGITVMQSDFLIDLMSEISVALGKNPIVVRSKSKCLSADVTACFDPNFGEVYEKRNSAIISCGTTIEQAAEKSGFNDSKYFARVVKKRFNCTPRELKL